MVGGIIGGAIAAVALAGAVAFVMYKKSKINKSHASLDSIVGRKCTVIEKIDNYVGCGLVKVRGQVWAARGVDEYDIFDEGETLSVVAVEGVKLICRK